MDLLRVEHICKIYGSGEVLALLKETARQYEQTVIMITHNPSIAHTADRMFQVSDGVLTDLGECRE